MELRVFCCAENPIMSDRCQLPSFSTVKITRNGEVTVNNSHFYLLIFISDKLTFLYVYV